ncbi:MAG: hypothetical protein RJA63_2208 [Pseudomonadota bacterium]|jgi:hypothetical protein
MARIRTIKPEFFTSEDIVSLSPLARLLYQATWCEADKEGRMVWKPKTMKLRYFPGDACDIYALCQELISAGLVVPYGDGLAYIPSFGKHQHINPREAASALPKPDASARVRHASRRDSDEVNTVTDAQVGREGKGREVIPSDADASGDGSEDPPPPPPLPPPPAPPAPKPAQPVDVPSAKDIVFALGVPLLIAASVKESNARSFLAMQAKAHGDEKVAEALQRCCSERPVEPVSWLQTTLGPIKGGRKAGKHAGFDQLDYHDGVTEDGFLT